MKALLQFECKTYFKRPVFGLLLLSLLLFGLFAALSFSISISPDIYKNSSYTISITLGLMSMLSIFFTTIFTTQILFKDADANFSILLFATPISKKEYLLSKFVTVFILSFLCFFLFVAGFMIGQLMAKDKIHYTPVNIFHYLQPLIMFGCINTLFCTSILCSTAWLSKNKLLVYVAGLFIYLSYMIFLVFSGSPLMAKGMPQSDKTILFSAWLDPFGLSAYFLQTSSWNVFQRNTQLMPLFGTLLFNRLAVIGLSITALYFTYSNFSFSIGEKRKTKFQTTNQEVNPDKFNISYKTIRASSSQLKHWFSLFSLIRINLTYISKSISFLITCAGILFYISMEIYGMIDSGIRVPQKYATSGLMAEAIINNLHGLCLIMILYYSNELVWKSRNSNFHLIENSTPVSKTSLFLSKWFSLNILVIFLTTLLIALGIVFQLIYHYPTINWHAYAGVYLYTSSQLIISAGIILLIQSIIPSKYAGLILSCTFTLISATSIGKRLLPINPLLHFQVPYKVLYSDMNGYGSYAVAQGWQVLFGLLLVIIFVIVFSQIKQYSKNRQTAFTLLTAGAALWFVAVKVLHGYQPIDKSSQKLAQARYEIDFKRFQHAAQPTTTTINTEIDLFPEKNAYDAKATYTIQNKTNEPISSILINFNKAVVMKEATLIVGRETIHIDPDSPIAMLTKPLYPGDSALFKVNFSYHWYALNGHHPYNAILDNGSFMRISRFYPTFGYQVENELTSKGDREKYGLRKEAYTFPMDSTTNRKEDFISLNMTLSTSQKQTAIGIGELVNNWKANKRRYFQYKTTSPIPFRFAVSSAEYAVKRSYYLGKNIEVFYHPTHYQNVDHLLKNAKLTLDYCQTNFGPYPFTTIRFAEVSAFTKGFAATAYPATVYMTENTAFNANIGKDMNQDVINELAGHELAHMWWGNSQISPAEREGSSMLTETLAMYTELMLLNKMYNKAKVTEYLNMHKAMYLNERGYSKEQAIYRVQPENLHISYSKGVVVMYQLTKTIGEAKVNLALKNFLSKKAYPRFKPLSTDFIAELYAVTSPELHNKIDDLLKRITLFDFKLKSSTLKKIGSGYELTIDAKANKYYEDGLGKQTMSPMNDTIEVAISVSGNKVTHILLPVKNNQILAKINLNQQPISILFDPDICFLTVNNELHSIGKPGSR